MADVAISCLAVRYCKIPINIEYLRCSMSIGLYKFELRCWRFPRQGFALPRNDILDGAVQQCDKHQFDNVSGSLASGCRKIAVWAENPYGKYN